MTPALALVDQQVGRARRRLFVQQWLTATLVAWAGALALVAAALLVEPYTGVKFAPAARWWVLSGAIGVASLAALAWAWRLSPSRETAAQEFDSRFNLQERALTLVSLPDAMKATPAGQALMADALAKVQGVRVREKFPVRLRPSGLLAPASAVVVALLAMFYEPFIPATQGSVSDDRVVAKDDKKLIDKKLEELVKKPREVRPAEERAKSEDLKRLEAKLDEIAKKPRDTTAQLRERLKELTPLEDEMKKLERERGEKSRLLNQQLQAKDKTMPNTAPQNGPAKELSKALAEGNTEKAKEELDKLSKKVANNELTKQEKDDLKKQLDQLQKQMERAAEQAAKKEQLQKLAQEGKMDAETLQREMEKIKKENQNLNDLQKMAQNLGKCSKCMQDGDPSQAAQALNDAAKQMQQIDVDSEELEELRDSLNKLQGAKEALAKQCDGDGECQNPGDGECDGNGQGQNQNRGRRDMTKDSKNGGVASGKRPDGQGKDGKSFEARQATKFDPKGQKNFDGYVPGQAFTKKSGVELAGEINQAAQDAPEAIEVQRIPKAARDMAKGYFKNLGGQKDAPATPPAPAPSTPETKP